MSLHVANWTAVFTDAFVFLKPLEIADFPECRFFLQEVIDFLATFVPLTKVSSTAPVHRTDIAEARCIFYIAMITDRLFEGCVNPWLIYS